MHKVRESCDDTGEFGGFKGRLVQTPLAVQAQRCRGCRAGEGPAARRTGVKKIIILLLMTVLLIKH